MPRQKVTADSLDNVFGVDVSPKCSAELRASVRVELGALLVRQ
jgi:hypothetical protein